MIRNSGNSTQLDWSNSIKLSQHFLESCKEYVNILKTIKTNRQTEFGGIFDKDIKRSYVVVHGITNLHSTVEHVQKNLAVLKNSPKLQNLISVEKIMTFVPHWPLVVHLLSGFFCLGSSAYFHLFWISNETLNNFLGRLDYGGICVLIMGSSYPPIFYVFSCGPILEGRNFFLVLITLTSCTTFFMLMLPAMNTNKFRMCRSITFSILGLSAGLPFIYVALNSGRYKQFYLPTRDGLIWLIGGIIYIAGALIYGFRIPEKYYPFKFDLMGSSHQIFHVAVIVAFTVHFRDSLQMYLDSQTFVCPVVVPTTF